MHDFPILLWQNFMDPNDLAVALIVAKAASQSRLTFDSVCLSHMKTQPN